MSENQELPRSADDKKEAPGETKKKDPQAESKEAPKSQIETPMYGVRVIVQKESDVLNRIRMVHSKGDIEAVKDTGFELPEFAGPPRIEANKILQVYKIANAKVLVGDDVMAYGWLQEDNLLLWKGRKILFEKDAIRGYIFEEKADELKFYNSSTKQIETRKKEEVQKNIKIIYSLEELIKLTNLFNELTDFLSADVGEFTSNPAAVELVKKNLHLILKNKINDPFLYKGYSVAEKQLQELEELKNEPNKAVANFAEYAQIYKSTLKNGLGDFSTVHVDIDKKRYLIFNEKDFEKEITSPKKPENQQ